MELKEFLKQTINEVMDAIVEVNLERDGAGKRGKLNPKIFGEDQEFEIDTIEFDIAITAGSKKQGSVGAGISVLSAKIGADGKIEHENSDVSRVRFTLGVAWPYAAITDAKKLTRIR